MTAVWLLLWIVFGAPDVYQWNAWAVWLTVCVAADLLGGPAGVRSAGRVATRWPLGLEKEWILMTKRFEQKQPSSETEIDPTALLSALEGLACRCSQPRLQSFDQAASATRCTVHSQLVEPVERALLRGAKAIKLLEDLAPAIAFSMSHTWGKEDFAELRSLIKLQEDVTQ